MMILGCKVNDYEANAVREEMNKYFREVDFKQKADIYLIFTCCVTNTAEAKTRKFIRAARRNNPEAYIAAIGCLVQIDADNEVFKDVDLLIGSDHKDEIVSLILEGSKANKRSASPDNDFEYLYIEHYLSKSRAFLKIQDGCDQYCSYCIIPYARGHQRNGDHEELLKEARILAKENKEIVLTGIHTGRYNDGSYDLYHLLCDLCQIDGLKTIRLSSIEINEISDEIIELIRSSGKMAHHLHIPVQSCEDSVLRLMNRPYTIEEYKERIAYIRSRIPDISISTDLIVGFPQESPESFDLTCQNIQDISFSFIHCFPYSRKKGTAADKMSGHIDPQIKKERVNTILQIDKDLRRKYAESFIGKECEVLIEKNEDGCSYGYTRQYIYTKIRGSYPVGEIYKVLIDSVKEEVEGHVAE